MQTNNHQLVDYDAVLDAKFGAKGTASRLEAEEKSLCILYRTDYRGCKKESKNKSS